MTTLAILGAGRVGTTLARAATRAGYAVSIAGSGPAEAIKLLVESTAPGARPLSADEAAQSADMVVLAVPMGRFRTLRPGALAGHVVVDAMNYWEPTDGALTEFADRPGSSSEVVQAYLPQSRLVKTLNHIGYHDLETDGRPAGTKGRRALALASDHLDAATRASDLLDRLGYDPVDAGPLGAGAVFAPGTPIFAGRFTTESIRAGLSDYLARHQEPAGWRLAGCR